MARTVIDLTDEWAEAARELGTKSKAETVNRAIDEVVAARRRRDAVEVFRRVRLDLDDPDVMTAAWR